MGRQNTGHKAAATHKGFSTGSQRWHPSDSASQPLLRTAAGVRGTHQVVLGLQLDLQGVDRASQLNDLSLVGLQLL